MSVDQQMHTVNLKVFFFHPSSICINILKFVD